MSSRGIDAAQASDLVRPAAGPGRRTALLLLAGLALLLGLLVYLADRRAAGALLLPRFAALGSGPIFGVIAQWLPSFIHPFAFSLLSAAAMRQPLAAPRTFYGACAFWWAVNLAFELAQHPRFSAPLADALQSGLGQGAVTAAISRYLLHGRFDWGDIAALSAGALAAAALLGLLQSTEDEHES